MCVVCGCNGAAQQPAPEGSASMAQNSSTGDLHYGTGPARASVPGLSQTRTIKLEADVLGANQRLAERNRAHFMAHGVTAYNLVSSPGAGKTTLLCATIAALRQRAPELPLAVIEGDQQTALDAERIRAAGAPAIQVNTGRGCHLDAQMVGDAFARLDLHAQAHHHVHPHQHSHQGPHPHAPEALLFIENVGNLVCPALWDLGEAAKVVILSVTEGADKPLKYPDMFAAATLMVINKIDLLPYVDFDVTRCIDDARRVNPGIEVLQLSATRGDGIPAWLDWLLREGVTLQPQP
jgi:hydrogenase nickel incorporation protein HypB